MGFFKELEIPSPKSQNQDFKGSPHGKVELSLKLASAFSQIFFTVKSTTGEPCTTTNLLISSLHPSELVIFKLIVYLPIELYLWFGGEGSVSKVPSPKLQFHLAAFPAFSIMTTSTESHPNDGVIEKSAVGPANT